MAYTPKTWTCGETITDAGLNNIEQGIQEALGCCESELPEVTTADNGKVLTVIDGEWDKGEGGSGGLPAVTTADNGDILTVVDGEWEKAEPGYECVTGPAEIINEDVTTYTTPGSACQGSISYSKFIDADTITVEFNGQEYELTKYHDTQYGSNYYGGQAWDDFSQNPFVIQSSNSSNNLTTPSTGTYSLKVIATAETISATECFEKAVKFFGLKYVADADVEGGVLANNVNNNIVTAQFASAEGTYTTASGGCSHAEGASTVASGSGSHSEGGSTVASGDYSHAEGSNTQATGIDSHAEGASTVASGMRSHAEGTYTGATGGSSHTEGNTTNASGGNSHAEGFGGKAIGENSHAEGYQTIANHRSQHVFGEWNVADASTATAANRGNYVEIVGNGTASTRSNARTLDWQGNETLAGSITLGNTTLTEAQLQQLLALI